MWRIVKKFQTNGTVHNLNKERSGRRRDVRTPESINAVRCSGIQSPKKSSRRRPQELGLNRMNIVRILMPDLKLFPCRFQIKHPLTANDEKTRVDLCNWFNDKKKKNQDWIDKVWFSDEVRFYLGGYIDSKNNKFWGTALPQKALQQPLHSSKVSAWCVMNSKTIMGPYWLEDENGKSVTVNQENYRKIISKFYSS